MSGDKIDSLHHEIGVLEARNDKVCTRALLIKACFHFICCCTVQLGKDLMKTEADLQSVRHAKAQSDAEYTANITSQTTGQHFIIFVLYPPTL